MAKILKLDKCYNRNKKYSEKDIRVRDHCHITGKYRELVKTVISILG